MFDIVIIGGGVIGTALARELSRYRLKVALLEKETELAFGVSKSNSGIIHPGTQNPPGSLKGKLCVSGNRLMRQIARDLGVDFKEVGELIVAFSEPDRERLRILKREAEELGVPGVKIVDRAWLRTNEPNLNPEAVAALYAPTAGIISPYRLVYDLAENAAVNGVEIFTGCEVVGIERLSGRGGFQIACQLKNGAPEKKPGPETSSQGVPLGSPDAPTRTFRARYVVNAAGLFADDIARLVGITDFTIHPRKGQEFLLDKKKEYLTRHLLFPLPQAKSKGVLVIKTSDGNPMIGPTAEDTDDKTDLATTDEGLETVLSSVQRLVPMIQAADIIAYFAGLRPAAGDDFIIRHEEAVAGFINVAGIQSPGLTAAPAVALMVVDLLKAQGCVLKKKIFFRRYRRMTTHLFAVGHRRVRQLVQRDPAYGDIICRCEMVSRQEVEDAIARGAVTLDGIKFRTRAQAGRCHGGFCTTRLMKILAEKTGVPLTEVTKRGAGSEIVKKDRAYEEA